VNARHQDNTEVNGKGKNYCCKWDCNWNWNKTDTKLAEAAKINVDNGLLLMKL
jgi:hypothetical protein